MTRIWIGPELEGYEKGILTMFVKAEILEANKVIVSLINNPECKRLYLGAGRQDVKHFDIDLFSYCDENDIRVIIETSPDGVLSIPDRVFKNYQIILRMDVAEAERLCAFDLVKVDTGKKVYINRLKSMSITSLETLHGDMFEADRILLEEETE